MKGKKKAIILLPLVSTTIAIPFVSTSCIYPNKFLNVDVTDTNLFFSSNNWLLKDINGKKVMSTYPGGAYIKVAFVGSTIGLDVYCTSSFPKRITFACYIDGNDTPIVKSLSQALGNILIFTDTLAENQVHTAKICIRTIKQENSTQNRFVWPDVIFVQNICIQKDKSLIDPKSEQSHYFVKDKNVLIYGDDYLEPQTVGSDLESNALLWEQYGYEYSLIGWTGAFVTRMNGNFHAPQFYNPNEPFSKQTFWNQYNLIDSRIDNDHKFLIKPDLIIVNLGMQDALNNVFPSEIVTTLTSWIECMLSIYEDDTPPIMLQMPYFFDKPNYANYQQAYTDMYETLYSKDNLKLSLMDLSRGADITIFYQSDDKIHPNVSGYKSLSQLMELALTPTTPLDFNVTSTTIGEINISCNTQKQKYQITPIITHYEVTWKSKDSPIWGGWVSYDYDPVSASFTGKISGLNSGTTYQVKMRSVNNLINAVSTETEIKEVMVS